MMEQPILKYDEVEVCSNENGFEGAWFNAILEDDLTKSGRKKLKVRYLTLLAENGFSPLYEKSEQRFIRPIQPLDLYDDTVLEEGSLVDVDYKDGWWTGVLVKKLEDDNFLVYFDTPSDIMEFNRNQLRPHFDWVGWKWVRPETRIIDESIGRIVELSSVEDGVEVAWLPVMVIKETEDKDGKKMLVVKHDYKNLRCSDGVVRPNVMVDPCRARPTLPLMSVEEYELNERVEVFVGMAWRLGFVREVLSKGKYLISLEHVDLESEFNHSDLRPFMVWKDGDWHNGPKRNNEIENPSKIMKVLKPMIPITSLNPEENSETLTEAETLAATTGRLRKKKAKAVMTNDKTPSNNGPKRNTVKKTSTKGRKKKPKNISFVAKPMIPTTSERTPLNTEEYSEILTRAEAVTANGEVGNKMADAVTMNDKNSPEPMNNQNDLGNDSTQEKIPEEENGEDKSRKRKRVQEEENSESDEDCDGSMAEINDIMEQICDDDEYDNVDDEALPSYIGNLSTERYFHQTPNVVSNPTGGSDVEVTQAGLPFVKTLTYWKECESSEGFKSVPQHPHFSPLFECHEDVRECFAIGMMVNFYELLKEVQHLRLDDTMEKLYTLSESFTKFERYGFDIARPQSRIKKLLSFKDGKAKKAEERQGVENERRKFEDKLLELKEKMEATDKKIAEMEFIKEKIDQETEDMELEGQNFLSAPW